MGFRNGTIAKVWEIKTISETMTKLKINTRYKNKQTEEYETDFSGYVLCVGTACANKAMKLNEGDAIRIGDCDVTTSYDKESKISYTNFKMFSFQTEEEFENESGKPKAKSGQKTYKKPPVDLGEPEDDDGFPF